MGEWEGRVTGVGRRRPGRGLAPVAGCGACEQIFHRWFHYGEHLLADNRGIVGERCERSRQHIEIDMSGRAKAPALDQDRLFVQRV